MFLNIYVFILKVNGFLITVYTFTTSPVCLPQMSTDSKTDLITTKLQIFKIS